MNPLVGKWDYVWCTIKNTSVKGMITFNDDGTFAAEVKMWEDHPTPPKSVIKGTYSVKGNQVTYENLEFDNEWYHPRPFGTYFLLEGEHLYFAFIKLEKAEKDYTKARWRYKLINNKLKRLFDKKYKDPLIFDHTPPEGIPGLKLYKVTGMDQILPGKPIPATKYIVTSDYSAYKGEDVLDVLKRRKFVPKSDKIALNAAFFILISSFEGLALLSNLSANIIEDYRKKHKIKPEIWKNYLKPEILKKENHFEVNLYGYYSIKGALFKFIIKIGEGIYELKREIIHRA